MQVICSWQKPIKLIVRFILLHGRPNQDSGKYWVLDAGCGAGTASLAAIMLGMSAYAFDMDKSCVDGTLARLGNWTAHGIDSDQQDSTETRKGNKRKSIADDDSMLDAPAKAKKTHMTDAQIQEAMLAVEGGGPVRVDVTDCPATAGEESNAAEDASQEQQPPGADGTDDTNA